MQSAETVLDVIRTLHRVDTEVITGEPGAGKLARRVRGGADGKGPACGHLAGGLLHKVAAGRRASHRNEEEEIKRKLAGLGDSSILVRFAGRKGALRVAWESDELTLDERRAAIKETIGPVAVLPAGPDRRAISGRAVATH